MRIFVVEEPADRFDDLLAAAESSLAFWDNPYDDEDWNHAWPGRHSGGQDLLPGVDAPRDLARHRLCATIVVMDRTTHPIGPYVIYWRQRQAQERVACLRLAQQARADASRIAAMLRRDFGVTRVVLFGSLARGRFLPDSDIDLAVEGLAATALFAALAQASELSQAPVDLKPLEDLDPHFKGRVLATGEDI
jgi:predicted nucleotidyltransferase